MGPLMRSTETTAAGGGPGRVCFVAKEETRVTTSMKTRAPVLAALTLVSSFLCLATPATAAEHRLGVGANYWRTIDDLKDQGFGNIDDSGVAWMATYQYVPTGLFRWEIDVEYFDSGVGGATKETLSPQIYLMLGSSFYAAVGIGVLQSDDFKGNHSDPFYAAKLGIDSELLPNFHLDLFANYRFEAWNQLDQAKTDTVFLGAAVRFAF